MRAALKTRTGAFAWIMAYILARYAGERLLDSLHIYASLGFDVLFGVGTLAIFWPRVQIRFSIDRRLVVSWFSALVLGIATYYGAGALHLIIPFDFSLKEIVWLLIVVAPIVEEVLHRGALWFACENLFRNPRAILVSTAVLFSAAHFWAYFQVPQEFKGFVIYQSAYALLLGLWWGKAFFRYRSLLATISLHALFNTGFYIGYRVWG